MSLWEIKVFVQGHTESKPWTSGAKTFCAPLPSPTELPLRDAGKQRQDEKGALHSGKGACSLPREIDLYKALGWVSP